MEEKMQQFEAELKSKSSIEAAELKIKLIKELDKTKVQVTEIDVAKKKERDKLAKIMEKMKELSDKIAIADKHLEE